MIKLLLLANEFPYGALEPYLETECEYYSGFGKIWVASLQLRDNHAKTRRELPIEAELIPVRYLKRSQYFFRSFYALTDRLFYKELGKLIKSKRLSFSAFVALVVYLSRAHHEAKVIDKSLKNEDKTDIVFYAYRFEYQPYVAVLLKKKWRNNSRIICRAHRYDLYEIAHKGDYIPLREALLEEVDHVFPCSKDGALYLQKKFPEYCEKIDVRYLGTKDHGPGPVPASDSAFRIVSCSTITEVKRVYRIIDALSMMSSSIEWTHYGDGPLMKETQEYAKAKLKDNISFLFKGNIQNAELMEEYRRNPYHLFINVSTSEGIPVSIMEAQSFGIPCVATDVGGTREILCNDSFSLVLPEEFKDEELVSAINLYIKMDKETYLEQREAARMNWNQRFNANHNYPVFVEELKTLK